MNCITIVLFWSWKWSLIGQGWSPEGPGHFWHSLRPKQFFSKSYQQISKKHETSSDPNPVFLNNRKWTSYGISGWSAWGRMPVHWSSFLHVFIKCLALWTQAQICMSRSWYQPQFFIEQKHCFIWSLLCVKSGGTRSLLWLARHCSKIGSKKWFSK